MAPLISVLMPVLNEEESLAAAVSSVLNQSGADLELLIIDGRSADRTPQLAAKLAATDPRVRVLDNPKVTIPAGLNVGLAAAHGDFVARVDGHARIDEHYFERALAILAAEPDMVGVGGRRTALAFTGVGQAIAAVLSSPYGLGNSINHYATEAQLTDHASFGVYRTEAARSIGGWDENLPVNEDVDFDHRLLRAGGSIGYEPAMVVEWQVRERLGDLFRQYRRYGRGKASMVRKNGPRAIRVRHLAPPGLVVAGAALMLLAPRQPRVTWALLPYVGVVAAGTLRAWRSEEHPERIAWPAVPAAFVATHVGWGLGFLEGLTLGRKPMLASGSAVTRAGQDLEPDPRPGEDAAAISSNLERATSTPPT